MSNVFRKFKSNLQRRKKFEVIGIGDIIQFNGGKTYTVKRYDKEKGNYQKVQLEPYRGYHPIPFPGDRPYENKVWESIRILNYEMEQKSDSIYSVTKTKQSEEPDFYRLSIEDAHEKAIEYNKNRYK
ncbi:hypothetical protein NSA56_18035 [Oceanobacillus caeni]|uniref:hypothetical protein n=1 Tax=Oceanobacillus caeni TaxID=405946 RepID=UPI0011C022F3|nr:hypothetical protein [Oceanobacillus caeni]MBU8792537.1 hypothetical protein [Oceanobacillus caeni]MCR1836233.1 hypothetical protein [Oceanobacillus caeni]